MLAETTYKLFKGISSFAKLERVIAVICFFIPLLLYLAEQSWDFRGSISEYVYMKKNKHVFGILLTIPAMLFIANGAIYLNDSENGADLFSYKNEKGKGYNILLGILLLGVAIFPCQHYQFFHYSSAILFFVGCSVVMWLYHENIPKGFSRFLAILNIVILALGALTTWKLFSVNIISLFWAEWISLIIIGFHYLVGIRDVNVPVVRFLFPSMLKQKTHAQRSN